MGASHTQPLATLATETSEKMHTVLQKSPVVDSGAMLSSSHPARIQNQGASSPAAATSSSSSTSSTPSSMSMPVSPLQLSANMKGVHQPNAATFLRLAALEQRQVHSARTALTQNGDHPVNASSSCMLPPLPPANSQCPSAAHKRARTSIGKVVKKGHQPRNLRLSLLPCENCSTFCQPDVLSQDGKVYCSGECYFSVTFRGEHQKIRNLYDQVFAEELDTIEEQTTQQNDREDDNDEYLQSCKRRARQLQESDTKTMPITAERPSLVRATNPIRIPLPHPDYVPY